MPCRKLPWYYINKTQHVTTARLRRETEMAYDYASEENRTEVSPRQLPGHSRSPLASSLPGPTRAPSPITTPLSTAPPAMTAPLPTMLSRTVARGPMEAPSKITLPETTAPARPWQSLAVR